MAVLQGSDGKAYDIPDENKDAALASGKFTDPSAPIEPGIRADVPSVEAPGRAPAPQDQSTEQLERAGVEPAGQVQLTERQTGAVHSVQEKEADALVASGSHSVKDVPLVNADDGKLYAIPDANIPAAIQSGKFRLSTAEERARHEAEKNESAEIERAGATGLKPIVGGAADALLAGVNEHNPVNQIGRKLLGDESVVREEEKVADAVKDEHPAAYYGGAGLGEAGSALALGGIAGGVSKAAGLSGAAKLATEGAIFSVEPTAKAIIDKDPAGAAEALALGVGLNFGLHGVFSAIESAPEKLGEAARTVYQTGKDALQSGIAPIGEDEAQNLIGKKVLGMSPTAIAETREQIGPALKGAGITADDVVSGRAIEKIQKLESSGPAIGRAIKALDALPERGQIIEDALHTTTEAVRRLMPEEVLLREELESKIASSKVALKEAATTTERLAARETLDESEQRLTDLGKLSPSARQAQKALQPILDEMEAAAKKGSFEETQRLKQFVRGQTNFTDNSFQNQLRKRAGQALTEGLMTAEDRAATALGSPEIIAGLRQQRALYTFHKLFGDAAERAAAKELPHDEVLHFIDLLHSPGKAGTAFGKRFLAKQQLGRAARQLLGESPAPTTDTILHALQIQKAHIDDSVKQLFSAFGSSKAARVASDLHAGSVREMNPEGMWNRSHAQHVEALRTAAQASPQQTAQHLGTITAPLRAEGLDDVAN